MKWLATLLLLSSFTFAQNGMQAPEKSKTSAHAAGANFKRSAQKMADEWRAAFKAKDADKIAAMYLDDAVLMTVEGTFHGSNEIKSQLKKMLDRGDTTTSIVTSKAVHAGDIGYAEGTFAGTGPDPKSGNQHPLHGSWVVSLKNNNGKWMIANHTSVPAAAGGMAKTA